MSKESSNLSVPARRGRPWGSLLLKWLCWFSGAVTMGVLTLIVTYICVRGIPYLSGSLFEWKYTTTNVSMTHAIINTLFMTALSLLMSVPVGVGGGIYLAEYAKPNSKLVKVIRITAETLAGIPSIVYALFGMMAFVITFGFGNSLIAGAMTLAIMTLPLILRQTEESLLSVPMSYREGSFGLGAGKLRTTVRIVLPVAIPGILAAVLLSIGRIAGETAALIFTSGTVAKLATNMLSGGRTLAVHLFQLQQEGLYINEAFAVAVVLLVFVVLMNALSSYIAGKLTKKG